MNHQQDLTPMERVDEALLGRILPTAPATEEKGIGTGQGRRSASDGCGCGSSEEMNEGRAAGPRLSMTDLSCGGGVGSGVRAVGFGVENGIPAALYVALQPFNHLYEAEEALERGTLFRALDKPFDGGRRGTCCHGER